MSAELVAEIGERRAWRSAAAAVRAMRPQQWTKNLLLFAGIVFAAKLGDGVRWAEAAASFALYCAASSAAYLFNDVRDRAADTAHPLKRRRPLASGDLAGRAALGLAGVLVPVESRATPGRRVLHTYSLTALDRLVALVAAVTVAVYAAYTVSAHDLRALPVTIPLVAFGLGRYVYLLRRRGLGEEPDQVLVSDKPILVTVAGWVVVCAGVVAVGLAGRG